METVDRGIKRLIVCFILYTSYWPWHVKAVDRGIKRRIMCFVLAPIKQVHDVRDAVDESVRDGVATGAL